MIICLKNYGHRTIIFGYQIFMIFIKIYVSLTLDALCRTVSPSNIGSCKIWCNTNSLSLPESKKEIIKVFCSLRKYIPTKPKQINSCSICCFTSMVNSWGHVGTLNYYNHTVPGQASWRQFTSNSVDSFTIN